MLRAADFLSVHVPDAPQTKNLLGAREIGLVKEGAYFVNTARAAAVEEEPLYQAIASGRIRAAAMDVFWNEPVQPDNRFVALPNVIATPHAIGTTDESLREIGRSACRSVIDIACGRIPPHVVNRDVFDAPRFRERLAARARAAG